MTDPRAQTIALEYVLGISIAFVLIVGLLTAGAGFVDDQRRQSTRAELQVIGQQVSADLEAADRLVASTESNETVRLSRELPSDATGSEYTVELFDESDPSLQLSTGNPDVSVRAEFANATAVAESTVSGGPVVINYTAADRLRLERGEG